MNTTREQLRHRAGPTDALRLFAHGAGPAATDLATHRTVYGRPVVSARHRGALLDTIEQAGLRGRGGAAFPTAIKMRAVAKGRKRAVVVVNGTEGEPISNKDATLLQLQPHLVLDGAALAAGAVGADVVNVCVERHKARSIAAVRRALEERARHEPGGVEMLLQLTPPRYVAGEETALVHWLNGGDARPTMTPPRPFERGVAGRPTLIDNVETLAHVTQIVAYGADWFRTSGTADEPGTALVTMSGAVNRPAVYEAPIGTRVESVLRLAGTPHGVGGVLIGGYFGSWLSEHDAATARLSNASLRPLGGGLGCGAVVVLPKQSCGVVESARVLTWMAAETAGQCGMCVNGLHAIAAAMTEVADGHPSNANTLAQLERWSAQIEGRGACRFPDGAIRFLRSALRVFADDFTAHARGLPCAHTRGARVLPIPTVHEEWR